MDACRPLEGTDLQRAYEWLTATYGTEVADGWLSGVGPVDFANLDEALAAAGFGT